ncbi:5'-nucleotidase C-terminal domain-containing protein [Hymenobacter sp. 15J16-1T3B]|uniref:5'-nucleotidase C-terminal domain-containing protein n=1 Tax=Hymenobacter sp. 15J16-1T3B TaxID=2886941 RepID=UPI001D12BAE1|nr:5'-nucleotidase C-terminal domain-containing protein [Hymenobacter sp. 15J16-1T3B]MCC3157268.1 5'-nucleotidase C-terminal domain-containing protein [Hymenobacter sp. 15J16-1T3B]
MSRFRFRGAALVLLLAATACQRGALQPKAQLTTTAQPVTAAQPADPKVEAVVAPYRLKVKQQMDEVIGHAPEAIRKNPGESPLANFAGDVQRERAAKELGQPIDLGVMTNGGLRAELPAGNITTGSIFELMPFENELVVLDAPASVVQQLFNYAAPIKMAISGATYTVVDGKPTDIRIGKDVFDAAKDRTYTIAISDYLAGGGDRLDFFRALPPRHTNVLLRTAFNDHIRQLTKEGKPVTAKAEGRVKF